MKHELTITRQQFNTSQPASSHEVSWLRGKSAQVALAYHFIGIGGCGMSGLAQMLTRRGHRVSGSDMHSSAVTQLLQQQGISVRIGHGATNIPVGTDCVVVSAAIKADNPELSWARHHGTRVCKYAELLGELSRQITTFAVAGTHGKSTTSGWLSYILALAGRNPNYVIGAEVPQLGGSSSAGADDLLVVEACEYDRSFLNLQPRVGAVLNIEADHLDYYEDLEEIVSAFGDFAELVNDDGLLVANGDDKNVRRALAGRQLGRVEYFGNSENANWRAEGLRFETGLGCFDLVHNGRVLGNVKLSLAGRHNVSNALATAAMASQAQLTDADICRGLADYTGAHRRMTYMGLAGEVVILDDYAHHPTEIKATLEAIRDRYEPERLWCVFQPHQHSRTRFLLDEFALSFDSADVVLLPEIYFVRDSEALRRTVSAEQLAKKICDNGGQAYYLEHFSPIADHLCSRVRPGDLVVTMGAGDIWKLADELICRLRRDS